MSDNKYDPMKDSSRGSAKNRGEIDAYYGAQRRPHKYIYTRDTVFGERIEDIGPEEVAAYNYGYDNQTDQKIWD